MFGELEHNRVIQHKNLNRCLIRAVQEKKQKFLLSKDKTSTSTTQTAMSATLRLFLSRSCHKIRCTSLLPPFFPTKKSRKTLLCDGISVNPFFFSFDVKNMSAEKNELSFLCQKKETTVFFSTQCTVGHARYYETSANTGRRCVNTTVALNFVFFNPLARKLMAFN